MKIIIKRFSLRIESVKLEKIGYLAEAEARSINSEIIQLIRRRIREYEEVNGEILPEDIQKHKTAKNDNKK